MSDYISFPEERYESFFTSGKEIKSLKSLTTRKQLSPHERGARDTFGLKNLNPFSCALSFLIRIKFNIYLIFITKVPVLAHKCDATSIPSGCTGAKLKVKVSIGRTQTLLRDFVKFSKSIWPILFNVKNESCIPNLGTLLSKQFEIIVKKVLNFKIGLF